MARITFLKQKKKGSVEIIVYVARGTRRPVQVDVDLARLLSYPIYKLHIYTCTVPGHHIWVVNMPYNLPDLIRYINIYIAMYRVAAATRHSRDTGYPNLIFLMPYNEAKFYELKVFFCVLLDKWKLWLYSTMHHMFHLLIHKL